MFPFIGCVFVNHQLCNSNHPFAVNQQCNLSQQVEASIHYYLTLAIKNVKQQTVY